MRVMGIDPGITRCGLGVVDVDESRCATLVYVGVARSNKDIATHFKSAVSGNGNADKAQVQAMVSRILRLSKPPKPADAADALAIAICHAWRGTGLLGVGDDSSVSVSISGRLTSKGSMTPAQRAWAEAQAAQRRTGAVDPRLRRK